MYATFLPPCLLLAVKSLTGVCLVVRREFSEAFDLAFRLHLVIDDPLLLCGPNSVTNIKLNRRDSRSGPPMTIPTMNEGNGRRETLVKHCGFLKVFDARRSEILSFVVMVGNARGIQPIELCLVVGNGIEADDTVDLVLFEPIDSLLGEALGCLVVRTRSAVYGSAREQMLRNLLPPQPPAVLRLVRNDKFLEKGVLVVGDTDKFVLIGNGDFVHD